MAGRPWDDPRALQRRLKADLSAALKTRDAQLVAVIRTLMAAIANAEAVELDPSQPKEVQGWAEAPRRRLTGEDLSGIMGREAADLRAAAVEYEQHGQAQEAGRLRRSAGFVDRYLEGPV
jgi:uncharacterized protein YqeY